MNGPALPRTAELPRSGLSAAVPPGGRSEGAEVARKRLLNAFSLVVLAWLASNVATFLWHDRTTEAQTLVARSYEERAELALLRADLQDLETNATGYVLTGAARERAALTAAEASVRPQLDKVARLAADVPHEGLVELEAAVATRRGTLDEVVALRDRSGLEAARLLAGSETSQEQLDKLQLLLRGLKAEEAGRLASRIDGTHRAERYYQLAVLVRAVLGIALLFWVAAVTRRALADIAERASAEQRAKEVAQRLNQAVEATHTGAWEWDLVKDTLVRSFRYDQIFGYESMLPGWGYSIFMQHVIPDDRAIVRKGFDEAFASDVLSFECRIRWPDGSLHWISIKGRVSRSEGGDPLTMVGTIADVTERRVAEERLQLIGLELERSNKELETFATIASHDLQEPLRKIRSFGSLVHESLKDSPNQQVIDWVDRMVRSASRMQQLLDNLLAYARVGGRTLAVESVDLNQVLHDVQSDLETRLAEAGGHIEVSPLPHLDGDPVQLRELFQNLVANALKFKRDGVPPVVKIAYRDGQIVVEDNGIGFEEQYAERIFGVFQRLHGRSEYEGTGIGLSICRKIVQRHGGTIVAHGRPGVGATFVIGFPTLHAGGGGALTA